MSKLRLENSNHKHKSTPEFIEDKGGFIGTALTNRYAVRLTDQVKETIDGSVDDDPVAKQYIPQKQEMKILPEEYVDPIGDDVHTPVKGIVHRYPDRVLLKLANVCAVYCRYCFRREKVGPGGDILNAQEFESALSYIKDHPEIREVILTGGDPLVLSATKLNNALNDLEAIEHIDIIRLHSRIPIADPKRMSDKVIEALSNRETPIYMVVHINHAQEITAVVKDALFHLHKAGCVLLSQSVLLKGVNDNADTLEKLFRALLKLRVKPYYLHHPDRAPGTSHFRLSISKGLSIMHDLHARLTGIGMPTYMLDLPGGFGKIPLHHNYVRDMGEGSYLIEDPNGVQHAYDEVAG